MFDNYFLSEYVYKIIILSFYTTLKLLFCSTFIGFFFGCALSVILVITVESGLKPNKFLYTVVSFIVNSIASFPVIIIIISMLPFIRLFKDTPMQWYAFIIPLSIVSSMLFARNLERIYCSIDNNLILTAKSWGAGNISIFFRVVMSEGLPSIILTTINISILLLSASIVAGALGAGGIGSVVISHGYIRFDDLIIYTIVTILYLIIVLIQALSSYLYNKFL